MANRFSTVSISRLCDASWFQLKVVDEASVGSVMRQGVHLLVQAPQKKYNALKGLSMVPEETRDGIQGDRNGYLPGP
jgi:hypothetical protein